MKEPASATAALRRPRGPSRKRRRTVDSRRRWLLLPLPLLLWAQLPVTMVDGGLAELAWSHSADETPSAMAVDSDGNVLVAGCLSRVGAYIAKFTAQGALLWRQEQVFVAGDCIAAMEIDDANRIYVAATIDAGRANNSGGNSQGQTGDTATTTRRDDSDVMFMCLSPNGELVWKQQLGTPFNDVVWALRVVSFRSSDARSSSSLESVALFVGGSSEGEMARGASSTRNCAFSDMAADDACQDGFVLRADGATGRVLWIHQVATKAADRVFAVDLDARHEQLVIVGETKGDLQHPDTIAHAGDIFAQRLDPHTGDAMWSTQIGDVNAAEICMLPADTTATLPRRGRCSVVIHAESDRSIAATLSLVASTSGLASTIAAQQQQYARVCASAAGGAAASVESAKCVQLMVSRLDMASGRVLWVSQLVFKASTSGSHLVRAEDASGDVLVLGTANAGLIDADKMEQVVIARFSTNGAVQWLSVVGLEGDDTSVSLARVPRPAYSQSLDEALLLAVGTDVKQRSSSTLTTYVRRVDMATGAPLAFCLDHVAFVSNMTRIECQPRKRVLAQVPLVRVGIPCANGATLSYQTATDNVPSALIVARPNADFVPSIGVVQFLAGQMNATIVVEVPSSYVSERGTAAPCAFQLLLKPTPLDVHVVAPASAIVKLSPAGWTDVAANGLFWRHLSNALVLALALVLVVVVCAGRLCWRRCFRRAKVFQYKKLRFHRRPSDLTDIVPPMQARHATEAPASARMSLAVAQEEEEADELRSHLEEIQQLNQSLEGLLHVRAHPGSTPAARSSPRRFKKRAR